MFPSDLLVLRYEASAPVVTTLSPDYPTRDFVLEALYDATTLALS